MYTTKNCNHCGKDINTTLTICPFCGGHIKDKTGDIPPCCPRCKKPLVTYTQSPHLQGEGRGGDGVRKAFSEQNLATYNLQYATCFMPDIAIGPDGLIKMIKDPTIFIGNGVNVYRDIIKNTLKDLAIFAPSHLWSIRALNIGLLAWKIFKKGGAGDSENVNLNYLRASEAEIKLTR